MSDVLRELKALRERCERLKKRADHLERERDEHGRCYSEQTMAAVVKERARLGRTVESLREALGEHCICVTEGLGPMGGPDCKWFPCKAGSVLAASSPDHTGAPEPEADTQGET